jgi:urease accessory protein
MHFNRGLGLATVLVLAASPALAHPGEAGHVHGLLDGLAHPLGGWDHLLAMVAVGLWAGVVGGRALWAWPAAFVSGMLLGGALGMTGVALPGVEHLILASVVLLGLAATLAMKPPVELGAALIVLLGLTHGNAHGLEAPGDASGLAYALGFGLATVALHAAGLGLAVGARRLRGHWLARGLGLGVALGGVALAAI